MYRSGPTIKTALNRPLYDNRPWCLNLGCGTDIIPTDEEYIWVNLDMWKNKGVDVVWDLENTPLPFKANMFDMIKCNHVLEHIRNWHNLMKDMNRILKPRGCLHIKVPEARCRAAVADPTHVNFFVPESWLHWDRDSDLGFETLKTSDVGYRLCWNEQVEHSRYQLDDGKIGNYFTELVVDFEKEGPEYPWETAIFGELKEKGAEYVS